MKKRLLISQFLLLAAYCSFGQSVGIGTTTPDASAALDITATNKGLLIPRMDINSINAIINPARGLLVYDSAANQLMVNIGLPAVPNWQPITGNSSGGWLLAGNNGTNPANQFVGTTDNKALRFRVNNIQAGELSPATGNILWGLRAGQANTTGFSNIAIGTDALKVNATIGNLIAIGDSALFNNTGTDNENHIGVGINNLAVGHQSLFNNTTGQFNLAIGGQSLFKNTAGPNNIAIGDQSLFSNTTGNSNIAIGLQSLFSNITGDHNTATGLLSLGKNVTGSNNTATGFLSLRNNTEGGGNTAVGATALFTNTTGDENTAVGDGALTNGTTGNNNTAIGALALASMNTGNNNTAVGHRSLNSNTEGIDNTATGVEALRDNSIGNFNTANGKRALFSNTEGESNTAMGENAMVLNIGGKNNVAVGDHALQVTTNSLNNTAVGYHAALDFNLGNNNTFIGAEADATSNDVANSIAIGEGAKVTGSNQVRFGNSATTSIGGVVGFTNLSDGRYKKNLRENVKGIDFIMKLRPVTYQLDIAGINKKLNSNAAGKTDDQSKKNTEENGKTIFSGFVAQEVEQAAKDAGYDFSGVDKPKNENDMYGLRYSEFVVPLVKAVQEQQQVINALKKINDNQKSLNDDLMRRLKNLSLSSTHEVTQISVNARL
jgi:hypothetical protein